MTEPVRKEITVSCDAKTAFDVFVRKIGDWWPAAEHSVAAMSKAPAPVIKLDPKVGGRIYEVNDAGEETDWGTVREMEDGKRILLNWHIGRPVSDATEVEVTFEAADKGTIVVLIHRNFEVLDDDADAMREGYNKGWVNVFENHFAGACG